MLDDRRDLLWAVVGHCLAASPLLAATWYLFSSTVGNADGGDKRFLGLTCAVAAGIIIARPFAALIAEPMGSVFFPRAGARPTPGYSLADAQRKRGQFERAMHEYDKIATEFPGELRAFAAMMEIAFKNLGDADRARAVLMRGLAAAPDEQMRMELMRVHRSLSGAAPANESDTGDTPREH